MGEKATTTRIQLRRDHAAATVYLDETGAIAQDRFFAVGCLVLPEPTELMRQVEKLRDKRHWYSEIKWYELTKTTLPLYVDLIDLVVNSDARYSCFVADRATADPVARFQQNAWFAYEKLATQLLIGAAKPYELMSVMADNYSTPDDVLFESDVRSEINRRLKCLHAITVCRLDSRACNGLQIVDVLTGAVAFEHRQNAGLAGNRSAKALLAEHVRNAYGVQTTLKGCKTDKLNVAIYRNPPSGPATSTATPSRPAP